MNSKVYKWCAVPLCKNTSIKTPNKVFVHVPNKKIIREKWLTLARRNPKDVVTSSPLYFCEDHFDLPNDMENYMVYHVMGSVSQVRMKPGCVPHKFVCQPDRKSQTSDTSEQPYIAKKRRMMVYEKCKKELQEDSIHTEQLSSEEFASSSSETTVYQEYDYDQESNPLKVIEEQKTADEITDYSVAKEMENEDKTIVLTLENEIEKDMCVGDFLEINSSQKYEDLPKTLEDVDVIYRVYKFLHKEYELLKSVNAQNSCDLSPLSDVVGRTASAIGVIRETVLEILEMKEADREGSPKLFMSEHNYNKDICIREKKVELKEEDFCITEDNTEDLEEEELNMKCGVLDEQFILEKEVRIKEEDFCITEDKTEDLEEDELNMKCEVIDNQFIMHGSGNQCVLATEQIQVKVEREEDEWSTELDPIQ